MLERWGNADEPEVLYGYLEKEVSTIYTFFKYIFLSEVLGGWGDVNEPEALYQYLNEAVSDLSAIFQNGSPFLAFQFLYQSWVEVKNYLCMHKC